MKAYKTLVNKGLALGFTVSVFDGEEWAVKMSSKYKEIIEAIESVEEAEITFYMADKTRIGWALIIPSLADDETVADHSTNDSGSTWIDRVMNGLGVG